jgi:hypothetical protein
MRGTLMSINYFRQYELRNRDIVTLAPAHEVNGISIIFILRKPPKLPRAALPAHSSKPNPFPEPSHDF